MPRRVFTCLKGTAMEHDPIITELDAARIRELGALLPDAGQGLRALHELIEATEEAEIVPGSRIPPDVVTIHSKVAFRDEATGSLHTVTIVYPHEFSIGERRISILSPVGRALLGRRVGDFAQLRVPGGAERRIRIVELLYQPEASGELTS
jgi:regulator of nucleoside diphosphate kinase